MRIGNYEITIDELNVTVEEYKIITGNGVRLKDRSKIGEERKILVGHFKDLQSAFKCLVRLEISKEDLQDFKSIIRRIALFESTVVQTLKDNKEDIFNV